MGVTPKLQNDSRAGYFDIGALPRCERPHYQSKLAHDSHDFLVMGDPFETHNSKVDKFLSKPPPGRAMKITNDTTTRENFRVANL